MKSFLLLSIPFFLLLLLTACSGKHLKVDDQGNKSLSSCFPLPNCVSSEAWLFYNHADALELAMPPEKAWPIIKEVVGQIPRTEIVESDDVYIFAKCRSLIFRFVDYLELLRYDETGSVAIRSSSAIALFDFGVNHLRIYKLKKALRERGVIKE